MVWSLALPVLLPELLEARDHTIAGVFVFPLIFRFGGWVATTTHLGLYNNMTHIFLLVLLIVIMTIIIYIGIGEL